MRRFENEDFPYRLAEGLDSLHLEIPDDEAQAALAYVRQFLYRTPGHSELIRGYLPENYVEALVRLREANSNRDLNSAVEALGVNGSTSTDVDEYTDLSLLEVEASNEAERTLSTISREEDVSEEARKNLQSLREIIRHSRDTSVVYYTPNQIFSEVAPLLDREGILL